MDSQQKPSYGVTYIEATQEKLDRKMENQKPQTFNNFTNGERKALKELSE